MNKVRELFGLYCYENTNISEVLKTQRCPFSKKRCFKTRKSDPQTAIGTCSVSYQSDTVIICPNRLLENNQVFIDCLHLLSLHEPGNELYVVPKVSIPGGSVDYFLVSANGGKAKDFVGIEFQTMDTTGTVWPERQRLIQSLGFTAEKSDVENMKSFGMNWKMTAKTILVQMHHKAETFEYLRKHLVLVIQKPFFDYMNREFSFSHIKGVRLGDTVHIHSYDFNDEGNFFKLSLNARVSTDSDGIAKALGLQAQAKVELEDIVRELEKKLLPENRLSIV